MDNYAYIDESGDLGSGDASTKHFIITCIQTRQPRKLEKVTKKIWRAKPQLHHHHELHAHTADEGTKRKFLHKLAELDIDITVTVVKKRAGTTDYQELYYRVLAEQVQSIPDARIIIVDKKDTNAKRTKIIAKLELQDVFQNVEFADSKAVKQLQAVDFVSWAAFSKYELQDSSYYEIIQARVVDEVELVR